MPGERKESQLSQSFRRIVDHLNDGSEKQYVWGCELKADAPVATWDHTEEDDDEDFVVHTLRLKQIVLGVGAEPGQRSVVELETKTFNGETLTACIASLEAGKTENVGLDLEFTNEIPVTFRLVSGVGPVHLTAQHTVEFPEDDSEDEAETEAETCDEDVQDAREILKAIRKRKASSGGEKKSKKAKKSETEEDGDEEEEDEENGEEDEENGGEEDGEVEVDEEEEDSEGGDDDSEEDMDEEDEEESEEEEEEATPEPVKKKVKKPTAEQIKAANKKANGKKNGKKVKA